MNSIKRWLCKNQWIPLTREYVEEMKQQIASEKIEESKSEIEASSLTDEQKASVIAEVESRRKEGLARAKRIEERTARINKILSEEPQMALIVSGQFSQDRIQTKIEIVEVTQN